MVLLEIKKTTTIKINSVQGTLSVKGPLGYLKKKFGGQDIRIINNSLFIESESSFRNFSSLLQNWAQGVNEGYKIELGLVGLGYKVIKLGTYVLLKLGHSHYIKLKNPNGMHIIGSKKRILIVGLDKAEVNRVSDTLRSFRKPDPYKGKGIRDVNKVIKLKVGKQK